MHVFVHDKKRLPGRSCVTSDIDTTYVTSDIDGDIDGDTHSNRSVSSHLCVVFLRTHRRQIRVHKSSERCRCRCTTFPGPLISSVVVQTVKREKIQVVRDSGTQR